MGCERASVVMAPATIYAISAILFAIIAFRVPRYEPYRIQRRVCEGGEPFRLDGNQFRECMDQWCRVTSNWTQVCKARWKPAKGINGYSLVYYDPKYNRQYLSRSSRQDLSSVRLCFLSAVLLLVGGILQCNLWLKLEGSMACGCKPIHSGTPSEWVPRFLVCNVWFHMWWTSCLWSFLMAGFSVTKGGLYNGYAYSWDAFTVISALLAVISAHFLKEEGRVFRNPYPPDFMSGNCYYDPRAANRKNPYVYEA